MEVVSSNTATEIERNAAREAAELALVRLTVELLRVVAGAGYPERMGLHVVELTSAFAEGVDPSPDVVRNWQRRHDWERCTTEEFRAETLTDAIITAALRIVAGRLAGQRVHENKARDDLQDHLIRYADDRLTRLKMLR